MSLQTRWREFLPQLLIPLDLTEGMYEMGISTTRRRSQLCCLQLYVWIHSSFRYIISKQRGILDQVQGRDGRHNIVEEIRQGWSGTTARGVGLSPPATFLTDSFMETSVTRNNRDKALQ